MSLFETAIVFSSYAVGRDKQSFAIARALAKNLVAAEEYGSKVIDIIRENKKGKTLIVSCGAGNSPANSFKTLQYFSNKVFALQLMDPNDFYPKFDLIVSPVFEQKYDNFLDNVLNVVYLPSDYEREVESEHSTKWKNWFNEMDRKLILTLVGGSSQFVGISEEAMQEMAVLSCKKAKQSGKGLFIVTSPRTDREFLPILLEEARKQGVKAHYVDWQKKEGKDGGVVNCALRCLDDVIVTGDSMSMITEGVLLGRNVFICESGGMGESRYATLHNYLYENNIAVPLSENCQAIPYSERGKIPDPIPLIKNAVIEKIQAQGTSRSIA